MAKKRKLRSNESESSSGVPIPEQIQTLPEPEQPEQSQILEDQTWQPEEGFGSGKVEESGEDETQNMNVEDEEGDENGGQIEENGGQIEDNDGDKGVVEEMEEDSDEEFDEEPIEKILEPFAKEQLIDLVKEAVSKLPEIIESVHRLADLDPAHRKIFVHGLGWDFNKETLFSVFGKYGEIEDCKVVSDKVSGKSKGYGFILFKHRNGARKALQQPQKKIGNRLTSCQLSSAGPVPAPPPVGPPVSEYTQRKIFISNVSADIDPHKLTEFFAKYGEIEEGPLGLDKQTGKFKGFCLFVYKTTEGSRKALEDPHKDFEGKTLNCQKAIDGPKSNKPNLPPQQLHQHQHQLYHHHHHHHQAHQSSKKEKNKYRSPSGPNPGHLMAPSGHSLGFNPSIVAPALAPSIGQALTALLTSPGAGLGVSNLLGGFGAALNQAMPPPMMNNPGYVPNYGGNHQPAYINQPGYQNHLHMGQGSSRTPSGGPPPPYMGYGQ